MSDFTHLWKEKEVQILLRGQGRRMHRWLLLIANFS